MTNVDTQRMADYLVGSGGDVPLALTRYNKYALENELDKLNEYEFYEHISNDEAVTINLIKRYRILTIIKTFDLIQSSQNALVDNLDNMKPSDLARTHTALLQTFSTLTTPATKVVFNLEEEVAKLADEMDLDRTEILREVKQIQNLTKIK